MNEKANTIEKSIAYIHGRTEAQIEAFASSLGLPASELTRRVGYLLLGTQSGKVLRAEDRMSALPGKTAGTHPPTCKVEVDDSPHHNKPSRLSPEARKKSSEAQKARWAKQKGTRKTKASVLAKSVRSYWSKMTPKERQAEMVRRIAKRAGK